MSLLSRIPPSVILVLRGILAATFLYAGLIKASASVEFALTLIPFTILPINWLPIIAIVLPGMEILAGLLLILPRSYKLGALLVLLLCLSFIVILAWALTEGIIVSCSCFGRDETPSAWKMWFSIGRDLLLAGAALVILGRKLNTRTEFT